jgi:polyribonucleotide nucleotidyltransferase
MFIMSKMMEEIDTPRPELSPYAPRIISMSVDPEKIRVVIGKGGSTINRIIAETGAKIDINDDGLISIASPNMDSALAAQKQIELLVKDVEVGGIYDGRVTRLMAFGAFVEILPGKEGLLHISKMAKERVEKVEDFLSVGDEIKVKVTEIDGQNRINLSRKELL